MRRIFRDPFSGLSHLFGALLGCVALVYLVRRSAAAGGLDSAIPFVIFGVSAIFMYSSSAVYHLLHVSDATRKTLRRIDHTMIFLLIAGSYTPYCMIALKDSHGTELLAAVWGIAVLGLIVKLFWMHAPRWLSTALYIFMGWIALSALFPLSRTLSAEGLFWLFAGGLFYTVGAIIYAVKRPDPLPPHFGFHEIWHLFVLAGTASHFYSITTLLY
jgi:hemolysin III